MGDPSIAEDPAIALGFTLKNLHPTDMKILRDYERGTQSGVNPAIRRRSAIVGKTQFIVGPEHGFSRTYVWGPEPGTFIQEMEEADAKLLMDSALDAGMFEDLDGLTVHSRIRLLRRLAPFGL